MKTTYCYRCLKCKYKVDEVGAGTIPTCPAGHGFLIRDYRSEAVGTDLRALRASLNGIRRSR